MTKIRAYGSEALLLKLHVVFSTKKIVISSCLLTIRTHKELKIDFITERWENFFQLPYTTLHYVVATSIHATSFITTMAKYRHIFILFRGPSRQFSRLSMFWESSVENGSDPNAIHLSIPWRLRRPRGTWYRGQYTVWMDLETVAFRQFIAFDHI